MVGVGAPDSNNTTVSANIHSATADGSSTVTISTVVADVNGDPVASQSVSVAVTGTNNQVSNASGKTDSSGLFTTTLKSTKAETKTITATVGSLTPTTTVTFKAGAASAATSKVVTSPNNTFVADNNTTCTLTATLLDAKGNPLGNQTIALTVGGSNNTLGNANGTSDANGVFTTTLVSSKAESKKITASAAGITFVNTVLFKAGSPNATLTTFAVSPNNANVVADAAQTYTLTTTALDNFSNPVSGQNVTVSATGTGNTFSAAAGATSTNGVFVTSLRSKVAEKKTITFTAGALTHDVNVNFVPGAAKAGPTYLTATPNTIVADANTTVELSAVVADAYNNIIAGVPITLTVSGGNNVINTATNGNTDANGTFRSSFTSTKAETKTVSIKVGATTVNATVKVTPGSPNQTVSTFVASPNDKVVANNSSVVTLTTTVRDVYGNPISDKSVTLASDGNGNTFSVSNANTNLAGQVVSTLKSTVAETKNITLGGAINGNATVKFIPGPGSALTSTLQASPNSNLLADNNDTTTLTGTIYDNQRNALGNTTITVKSSGTNNTLGATSGTTDPNGQFVTTLKTTKAETKTVSFTAGGATINATVAFGTGEPNTTASTLVVTPKSVVANDSTNTTITGTIRDRFGNPITAQAVSVSVTGGNNTLGQSGGNTTAAGVFTTTLKSRLAEEKVVTLTAGNVTLTQNVTFIAGAGNTTLSSLTFTPNQTLVADNNNVFTLHGTVLDALSNPLVGQSVSMSATGTGATFGPTSGVTDANGNFNTTVRSSKAEAKTITLKAGTAAPTVQVTFIAGSPNEKQTLLAVSPLQVVADGNTTATITATVRDALQNPIADEAVTLSSSGGNVVLGASSGNTTAAGVFTTTVKSSKAELKVLSLSVAGFTVNANVTFNPGAPDSNNSTFVVSPNTTTANNSNTLDVTTTLQDSIGNPVPNYAVALSANGTLNIFSKVSGKTDPNGVFASTLKSSKAEAKTVTVKAGKLTLTQSATFTPGPVSAAKSTLVATPAKAVADNNTTVALKATVLDATGNPVPDTAITLASTGTGNTLGSSGGNVDANGVLSTTLKSSHAEIKVVTVTAGGVTFNTNVTFVAGSPNTASSTLAVSPNSGVVADNKAGIAVTGTLIDDFGNPVSGQAVSLNANGTGNAFAPASGPTNSNGIFTSTMRSTGAQTKTLTLHAGDVNMTTTVGFVPGPVSVAKSTVTLSPNTVTVGGDTNIQVSAVLKDAYGNLVTAQPYTVTVGGSDNTIGSGGNGNSDANGTLTATFRSNHAETKKITITAGQVTLTASAIVKAGSPNATLSSLTLSPNASVVANDSSTATLTATVVDDYNNPISGLAGKFSSASSGVTITPAEGNTTLLGQLVGRVRSSVAETAAVSYKSGSLTLSANATFVPGAASSVASDLVASPRVGVTANGTDTVSLTATVADALDNRISAVAVTLSSSVGSDVFGAASGTTDGNGVFTTTVKATAGGTRTITVKAGSASSATTVVFDSNVVAAASSAPSPTMLASAAPEQVQALAEEGVLVASVDLNGDGIDDLAMVDRDAQALRVLLGDGAGNFVEAGSYAALDHPVALTTGDVDGDGHLDVALANGADGTVSIFGGNGTGHLSAARKIAGVQAPSALALIDLTGDGLADLALGAQGEHAVQVLANRGDGSFVADQVLPTAGVVTALVAGDFDGDGRADLASASGRDVIEIFLRDAGHGFVAPALWHAGGTVRALLAGDVDGDGLTDLTGIVHPNGAAQVLHSEGGGRFAWRAGLRLPAGLGKVVFGDVNGDARLDVIATDGAGEVTVGLGQGTAQFAAGKVTQVR